MSFIKDLKNDYFNDKIDIDECCVRYKKWVNTSTFMTFEKECTDLTGMNQYMMFKMAKRGNDVYKSRVRKRLKPLSDLCSLNEDVEFIENKTKYAQSNLLFVTLTYDTKLKKSELAWLDVGKELNRFMSALRQEYGNVSIVRCFEAYKNGFPHIHAIILFEERTFRVKRHIYYGDTGKLKDRYIVPDDVQAKMSAFWHSWVNVCGVKNLGGIGYLLKYITKESFEQYNYLTTVLNSIYRKRSYSISNKFIYNLSCMLDTLILQLDTTLHNSNIDFSGFYYYGMCDVAPGFDSWFFQFEAPDIHTYLKEIRLKKQAEGDLTVSA